MCERMVSASTADRLRCLTCLMTMQVEEVGAESSLAVLSASGASQSLMPQSKTNLRLRRHHSHGRLRRWRLLQLLLLALLALLLLQRQLLLVLFVHLQQVLLLWSHLLHCNMLLLGGQLSQLLQQAVCLFELSCIQRRVHACNESLAG